LEPVKVAVLSAFLLLSVLPMFAVEPQAISIQRMINVASPGTLIIVPSGLYCENVVVNKSVSLTSLEPTTVYAFNASKHVFEVTADNVSISGFTIKGANDPPIVPPLHINPSGIFLNNTCNCIIMGNTITNNSNGIFLFRSNNNLICNNNISGNSVPTGAGIIFLRSDSNRILNNVISKNSCMGIFLWYYANHNLIAENIVADNGMRTGGGITIFSSVNNTVEDNLVKHNMGEGLDLNNATYTTVRRNVVSLNFQWGIMVSSGVEGKILNTNNLIYLNNFVDNYHQYCVELSVSRWDNGSAGNFWSDYKGLDYDHDGIGDTAYVLDELNQDHAPLMKDPSPPPATFEGGGAQSKHMLE